MAKISAKGQLTIPKKIREKLKIKEGDKVLFFPIEKENKTVIYPVKGTLLDLRRTLESKKSPEDLEKVREKVKKKIGRRVADEGLH